MGRVGRILMVFGFLAIWLIPVLGAVVMVAGAIITAIQWEEAGLSAPATPESPLGPPAT